MNRVPRAVLKAVGAPSFAVENNLSLSCQQQRLQLKLGKAASKRKLKEFLRNSDAMMVFSWVHQDVKLDKAFAWQQFAKSNGKGIYLKDDVCAMPLTNIWGLPGLLPKEGDSRGYFQSTLDVDLLNKLIESTKTVQSNLALHCLGINVNAQKSNVKIATYLQSLAQEANDRYKDINYDKLLEIARSQQNATPEEEAFKRLLSNLADLGLSSPNLVQQNKWIVFTKSQANLESII